MTPWDRMCFPTIHFQSPHHISVGWGLKWGEQQENRAWDSAAGSVVARAERMACCAGQRRYCVSGPFTPSVFCPLFYEYHPSIQALPARNLFIFSREELEKI